jgi:hypothetical protein
MRTQCDGGLASIQSSLAQTGSTTVIGRDPGNNWPAESRCAAAPKPSLGGTRRWQTSNSSSDRNGSGKVCLRWSRFVIHQSQTQASGGGECARRMVSKLLGGPPALGPAQGVSFASGPLIFLYASRRVASPIQAGREAHLAVVSRTAQPCRTGATELGGNGRGLGLGLGLGGADRGWGDPTNRVCCACRAQRSNPLLIRSYGERAADELYCSSSCTPGGGGMGGSEASRPAGQCVVCVWCLMYGVQCAVCSVSCLVPGLAWHGLSSRLSCLSAAVGRASRDAADPRPGPSSLAAGRQASEGCMQSSAATATRARALASGVVP